MLRLVALLLVLANGVYFVWSQGFLASWGLAPVQQSEPQRLQQQLRPEALRVMTPDEDRRGAAAAAAAKFSECLQAGPFDEVQAAALREGLSAVAALPAASWSIDAVVQPARWIVYMGKYTEADMLAKKKAELRARGVSFEPLSNAALEPGLSLGGFDSQAAAQSHLETLAQKGVRTARVVQERAETRSQRLTLPAVDEALRPRLEEIKPLLNGKTLRACS